MDLIKAVKELRFLTKETLPEEEPVSIYRTRWENRRRIVIGFSLRAASLLEAVSQYERKVYCPSVDDVLADDWALSLPSALTKTIDVLT